MKKTSNPTVIKNAKVRYHASKKSWVVLGENNEVLQTFKNGVMTNVRFEQGSVYEGCGSTRVGFAIGNLRMGEIGKVPKTQVAKNFSMTDEGFKNSAGEVMRGVNILNLYSDRKSVYLVTRN